ncbi:formylglycine-generating enzyme family protein [Qipengyuania pacifica]|uniref:formylglycine-generating enzyme family protein n=1 Tax=Qipengyuania pacifica TaxID=2860199 RepID=UPI001FFCC35E|nr:formylglycine-generating enzyme family protein [Qipengyuania aerophila]
MAFVPGGTFLMGSERFYPEEAPVRQVRVDPFMIDIHPVTNRKFSEFISQTGYTTTAEIAPDPAQYPNMPEELARAGSLVFHKTRGPVDLSDASNWWSFIFGAYWKKPLGPDSDIDSLDLWDHPVVHVTHDDARAYAEWCGKALPTEAEFEFAARGGCGDTAYSWGSELAPGGQMLANYWQGLFPFSNLELDGWERTSPVGTYPANGYGIYDMIGNTWEWTEDWWRDKPQPMVKKRKSACCTIENPKGGRRMESLDKAQPDVKIGRKVIKGGSHLCAENYCQRYRPAARHPQMIDSSTSHIGFRCVLRDLPG